jgi:hypothetical protein
MKHGSISQWKPGWYVPTNEAVITRFPLTLSGNEVWLHNSMETGLLHNHKLNFVITIVTCVLLNHKPAKTIVWQTRYDSVKPEVTLISKCESSTHSCTKSITQGWKIAQDVVKSVPHWQYKVTGAKFKADSGNTCKLIDLCPALYFYCFTYGEQ